MATSTVGLLCGRIRMEEKGILAALAIAGVPAMSFPPTDLPLPTKGAPTGVPLRAQHTALTTSLPVTVAIDRCQDRAVAGALLPMLRVMGIDCLDAGLAATGTRVQVAVALAAAGLPQPDSQLVIGDDAVVATLDALGGSATLMPMQPGAKPVALWDHDTAEAVIEHRNVLGCGADAVALLQAGIPAAGDRATIIVAGGQAVSIETAGDVASFSEPGVLVLASLAARALGAALVGIEVARTPSGWVIWDVHPVPDFRSAISLGDADVATTIAQVIQDRWDARVRGHDPELVELDIALVTQSDRERVHDDIVVPA